MAYNYIEIIGDYFPGVEAYIAGGADPSVYANVSWVSAPVDQATLEAAADSNTTTQTETTVSFVNEQSYETCETKSITLPQALNNVVVHVLDPNVVEVTGSKLVSPSGTGWDPGSVSGNIDSINNGVYTDLAYNNVVSGNTSGVILGIDMGAPTAISRVKRWDYSTAYFDTAWEFIGTNNSDGTGYTVIETIYQKEPNLDPNPYDLSFTEQTFRYFGCRCVESFNATYTIVRELELYSGGTLNTVEKKLSNTIDYEYRWVSPTEILITSLSGDTKTLKTIIIGT